MKDASSSLTCLSSCRTSTDATVTVIATDTATQQLKVRAQSTTSAHVSSATNGLQASVFSSILKQANSFIGGVCTCLETPRTFTVTTTPSTIRSVTATVTVSVVLTTTLLVTSQEEYECLVHY